MNELQILQAIFCLQFSVYFLQFLYFLFNFIIKKKGKVS